MGWFGRMSKATGSVGQGVITLRSTAGGLSAALAKLRLKPTFIVGYVSPHNDIDQVAGQLRSRFPGVAMALCSTAGELCGEGGGLYCGTDGNWDSIVLQCFDASLVARAQVIRLPLECDDLRRGQVAMPLTARVERLGASASTTCSNGRS